MSLYDATIPVFSKHLAHILRWIDKATAHAQLKKVDPELFVGARLVIDQYDFARQVQSACDATKFAAAKLTGKVAPSSPDTETTLDQLRTRIRTTIAYLEGFKREDFVGSEERSCSHVWMEGKSLRGADYLDHLVLPNLHFHLTTAYSILRANGVDVGKDDYIGALPFKS